MSVDIDEPGRDDLAGGIDDPIALARLKVRANFYDAVALRTDVGRTGGSARPVDHLSAADEQRRGGRCRRLGRQDGDQRQQDTARHAGNATPQLFPLIFFVPIPSCGSGATWMGTSNWNGGGSFATSGSNSSGTPAG